MLPQDATDPALGDLHPAARMIDTDSTAGGMRPLIAFNGTAGDWQLTEDAVNLDGVGYDRLFNAVTGTELYLDNADALQWV